MNSNEAQLPRCECHDCTQARTQMDQPILLGANLGGVEFYDPAKVALKGDPMDALVMEGVTLRQALFIRTTERERCAKIADKYADLLRGSSKTLLEADPHGRTPECATAAAIASEIREEQGSAWKTSKA